MTTTKRAANHARGRTAGGTLDSSYDEVGGSISGANIGDGGAGGRGGWHNGAGGKAGAAGGDGGGGNSKTAALDQLVGDTSTGDGKVTLSW